MCVGVHVYVIACACVCVERVCMCVCLCASVCVRPDVSVHLCIRFRAPLCTVGLSDDQELAHVGGSMTKQTIGKQLDHILWCNVSG